MNKRQMALGAAVALALALLVWVAWPAPQQVETAPLVQGDFVRELVEDARTQVRERYTVAAPLAGQLMRPALRAGDAVHRGQTVARIEAAAASLLDVRSQGEQFERVQAMQASVQRAQANQARALLAEQQAQIDLQRSQTLARQGFVSSTQEESAQLALRQRQQELAMADQELQATRHDLQRLRIGLAPPSGRSAGQPWPVAAPVDGRVLRLHRDSAGPIAAGAPILELGDPTRLQVVAELLTEDAATLPARAQASLGHADGTGRLRAVLVRTEAGAFTKVSALGVQEQRVNAVFDWLDAPPSGLGDGYRMDIRIVVQQAPQVPLAPVSAVFPQGQGHAVFVLEGGRARLRQVQLLGRNGQQAWLRTTLPAGTRLVVYPPATLRDGDRVQPLRP